MHMLKSSRFFCVYTFTRTPRARNGNVMSCEE
jgi:hypothetical protein